MPHTILVVDDDPITQRVLRHYLARTGHHILSATNGREAIDVAKRELPQLIILDVMMPEMGGLTALRQLKEIDTTKSIPVVIVTVQAAALTQLEAEASGAALFITKPFSPTQLLASIKRLLPQNDQEET
jgi:two-component system alkaline phosphatase synthesis response regulator PhoP